MLDGQERKALEVIAALSDRRSTPEWDQVKGIARAALAAREPSERLSECCKAEVRTGGGTGATHYYVCSVCEKACGLAACEDTERPESEQERLAHLRCRCGTAIAVDCPEHGGGI